MVVDAIRIRAKSKDGLTEVLVLMPHPMETGLRKDVGGNFVAAHYIDDVQVRVSGRLVLQAKMSIAVSKDPLLSFRFRGGAPGEKISVQWSDNRGTQSSGEALIT